MLFVFLDDATLDVLENIEEARSRYEAIDVESGDCAFYDANGNYLKPTFPVPNKKGKFFGIFPWVSSGTFDLAVASPAEAAGEDPIWLSLYETNAVNANPWFRTMGEVKEYLRQKNVKVDRD